MNKTPAQPQTYYIVVGGGMAGLVCAAALLDNDCKVTLIAPASGHPDRRTTALLDGSVKFLKSIGVWELIDNNAASMKAMRIVDNTDRLLRAPLLEFKANEIGLETFGYNISNIDLTSRLHDNLVAHPNCEIVEENVKSIEQNGDEVRVQLESGNELAADILIGADGRNSVCRTSLGIKVREWNYPQTALVGNFIHTLPHGQTSTEFHTETGPFTIVPLPADAGKNRSSLVWVETPEQADHWKAQTAAEQNLAIEERMHSILGKIELESPLHGFGLGGLQAESFAIDRVFLIGEAAHVLPPIGAQGFNLGLRDIEILINGLPQLEQAPAKFAAIYDAKRKRDVHSRVIAVDAVNRSLLSDFLPAQLPRAIGLHLMQIFGPLKRFVMREGLGSGEGFAGIAQTMRDNLEQVRKKVTRPAGKV